MKIKSNKKNFPSRKREVNRFSPREEVTRNHTQRFQYLAALYKIVEGSPLNPAKHQAIVDQAGLSEQSGKVVFHYLLNEGYIKCPHLVEEVSITHQGIKKYEGQLDKYKERQHSQAARTTITNIVNISGTVAESQFSFGDQACTLETNLAPIAGEIIEIIGLFKDELAAVKLEGETKNSILSELESIETQLKSSKPKRQLINTAIKNLRGALSKPLLDAGVGILLSRLKDLCSRL